MNFYFFSSFFPVYFLLPKKIQKFTLLFFNLELEFEKWIIINNLKIYKKSDNSFDLFFEIDENRNSDKIYETALDDKQIFPKYYIRQIKDKKYIYKRNLEIPKDSKYYF